MFLEINVWKLISSCNVMTQQETCGTLKSVKDYNLC